jgi:adenylate cyclase class 2
MREIEIKVRANDLIGVEHKLLEKGVALSAPITQHDVIYAHKKDGREFSIPSEGDIIMRIRYYPDRAVLTLKQQKSGEMDNLEYETDVKEPDEMHSILLAIGYEPIVEVDKVRRKGKFGEYEICLDDVKRLGTFVELEKMTSEDADPQVVREELFAAIETLGLSRSDEETKGYETQLYLLETKS